MNFRKCPRNGREFAENARIIDSMYRLEKGLTQREAALRLGIKQPTVSRYLTFARRWTTEAKRIVSENSRKFSYTALYRFTAMKLSDSRKKGRRVVRSGSVAYRYIRPKSLESVLLRHVGGEVQPRAPKPVIAQRYMDAVADLAEEKHDNRRLRDELRAMQEEDVVHEQQKKISALMETVRRLRSTEQISKQIIPKSPDTLYQEELLRRKLGVRVNLWPDEKKIELECLTDDLFNSRLKSLF